MAAAAGVSVSTASRALRGDPSVSEALRDEIYRSAKQVNYVPNTAARSLRDGKTLLIGLVVPDITTPFFAELAKAVSRALADENYSVLLCDSDENFATEQKHMEMLQMRQVDGLIVVPSPGSREEYFEEVAEAGMPIVLVDRLASKRLDSVRVDNTAAMFQVVAHFISRGYRRFGVVRGRQDVLSGKERWEGFKLACGAYKIAEGDVVPAEGHFTVAGGYDATKRLLEMTPRPDAIFATTSVMGAGALKAIKEAGLRMPEDIALAMFDDVSFADMTDPPLTVVTQPTGEIGRLAAACLRDRMRGEMPLQGREILVPPALIVRGST